MQFFIRNCRLIQKRYYGRLTEVTDPVILKGKTRRAEISGGSIHTLVPFDRQ